ncbi:PREDICTED: pituitary tumor-transforming gene 1 protein-interacting protein-like [Thamnophis sirtalis]|uniref:Pituitary tumor-transforming gene 1 protein-interacting protein-like n=1 Tax=Thamnophis sirtalis TaxID=35019 RepID=A0A6I9X6K7_9SAUR|nr:PREDICTED: pituitary tumor-transforming gene 1 protein-interacting protein-like [Thamnophis sirtalis]
MRAGARRSSWLVGFALGESMSVTMACGKRLWTLAVLCALLCLCPTMELHTTSPSSTPAPSCSEFTGMKCEACIKNTACLWCSDNSTCMDYPVNKIMPPSSLCSLTKSYWGICWASLEAIIITIAVVVGIILVFIICCCCYCYRRCRQRSERRAAAEEEETFIGDREEKQLQHAQRKHERKVKCDELRRKYGLLQDSDHPYSRYENE